MSTDKPIFRTDTPTVSMGSGRSADRPPTANDASDPYATPNVLSTVVLDTAPRTTGKSVTDGPRTEPFNPLTEVVKLSVNVSTEAAQTIRDLARKRGTSMTEVIRHAIAIEKFLQDEVIEPKARLIIEERDGTRSKVHFAGLS